ncbi:MAG: phosphatase PAP2 family protein [Muribaculaceae bacterium]|nr:phosphatase PAP2 family protein [Muribaculaceae bacterium]
MTDFLLQLDENIFLALHHLHRSSFADDVMWLISSKWTWVPMYVALLYWISSRQGWRRALVWTLAIVLAVAIADQVCASVIRPFVGRLRPANLDNPLSSLVYIVRDYRGGANGFPSCHAANTFAVAGVVALAFRNRSLTFWFLFWALINCLSRIYLGVHYPGDLLVGAVIGMLAGWGCVGLAKCGIRKWVPGEAKIEDRGMQNPVVIVGILTAVVVCVVSLF